MFSPTAQKMSPVVPTTNKLHAKLNFQRRGNYTYCLGFLSVAGLRREIICLIFVCALVPQATYLFKNWLNFKYWSYNSEVKGSAFVFNVSMVLSFS